MKMMKYLTIIFLLSLTSVSEGAKNPFTPLPIPKPPARESLTDYSFEELELKAVIWGTENSVALFQAIDGKGFTAKIGTAVGKKGGKVTKIDDKVVIIQGGFGKKGFKIRGR